MKYQINLLDERFKPKFVLFSFANTLALTTLVLVLCSVVYGALSFGLNHAREQSEVSQNELANRQQSLSDITAELTSKSSDPALESEIKALINASTNKSTLLANIQALSEIKQPRFSLMLDSLANAQTKNLWLTHFSLSEEELKMVGAMSTPEALPAWLKKLRKTEFFNGKAFTQTALQREDDVITFTLSTKSSDIAVGTEASVSNSNAETQSTMSIGGLVDGE